MPDVLVALVLLAIVLTGACTTLIQSLRSTHGAVLATRAVDLATDLSEQLEAADPDDVETILAAWRTRIGSILPVGNLEPEQFAALDSLFPEAPGAVPGLHELTLQWHADGNSGLRTLRMPLLLSGADT